ncbi:MAG: cadherin domain-containing protein [Bacteroidales bacterium]|nr:cadherin domain-containing protein [Bacteroidales bacterium]
MLSVANSASINFESLAVFNLIIKVQDNGTGNLNQATITVNILNLNELPVIANQAFSTNENSANGTTVGTVIATDPDAGQTLNFTILSGNSNTAFSISSTTGIITVANSSALNFETSPSFALVVKVQDNGTGSLSSQATVTITLLNINEPPVITNQSFSINENSANGTAVGTVIASDPDAGQTKTFSILSGNTNTAFAISSTTGVITVANSAALNFESTPSFALVIKVQDNGTGNLSSQATVTINLINTNEPPVIINQSFSINENSSNGTTVGTVIATDPDAGQTKTFSILSGNTNTAFAISSTTGIITVANSAALNFESTPSFALVIKVQDNGAGSLSSQATVTITLININEPPVITNQSFSINENSVNGTTVGTVIATDPDAGQTKTFSILSGNTNSTFVINSLSGVISVANSSALNFEATPSYDLIVKVQDNGTGNLSSQATVMINLININEPPVVNNQTFTVTSGSANGTSVGIVAASDPDAGQILTYSIISGNTSSAFIINSSSGQITVNNAIVVNYTTNPVFSLLIKVQDNGTGNLYDEATITINVLQAGNMPPVITNQTFNLNENAPNGSTVGAVVASDPNAGQTLTYSILSGNTNNAFIINAISGLLSVANSTAINFESITAFNLIIKVQDNGTGNLSSQATITVNILNLNEVPLITNQAFSINENSSNGVSVGMVIATDPDAGQLLTFSILSGNTNGAFAINSATGVIIVTNSGALNFETIPSFTLVVKVHDNGSGNLSSQATVTITLLNINEQPVISNQSFSINENSANGTTVGTVIATDPDAGQTLTYSILSGNTGGAFAINSTNGNLIVTNSTILNYEVTPFITIAVKVQDNGTGNLNNQGSITININNINEQPILSNQIFNVNQFTANGSSIGTVLATDPDVGQTLTYSIIAGNVNNGFGINPVSGVLFVNNSSALNPGATPVFYLSVQVMDNGSGNLTNSAVSTINILATGNQPPVIANQTFTLNENSANGTSVGTVIASDPNVGQSITYSIISGNTNGAFAINASSGQLIVSNSASINFELIPTFSLIVKVQDNGTGNLSSQATITINISNLNEPPIISNQIFSVSENSSNGTIVGTVVASDPDAGQSLTYTILSGNTSGAFAINSANGTLIVANSAALNYELITSFVLVIKVQDNGVGLLSSQANATVNLLNVNDSPNINNQAFAIEENSMNGTTIGTVEAQDQDVSQLLTYQIISGNPGGAFYINNATGKLLVSNSSVLDFENQSTFQITISVSDNGNPNSSSQATITINLIDIEDVLFTAPTVYSNGSLNNYLTNGGSSHFEDSLTMQNHDNGDTKIEWSIYPNPSGGIINVEIPGLQSEWILINIFNVEGKTVYVHKMDNVNKEVLDLGQLPSGTYYMLIQSEDKKSSKKFIIR